MQAERFDAIVIGAGQAGPPLAGRLTSAGMKVALVERSLLGGTCVNRGCTPTKALVASARAAHVARHGADWGLRPVAGVAVDMPRVRERAAAIARQSRESVAEWLKGMKGLTLLHGHAQFEGPRRIRVGERLLEAPRIILNTGARPVIPDLPGLENVPYLTSTGMLALNAVPEHLLILGGSYIALEFAQMFRRFGAEVTVIERGARLLAREDEDISQAIREILEAEGIVIRTGVAALSVEPREDGVALRTDGGELSGSHLLVAVGRRPNTDDLGLEVAGLAPDKHGYIPVDDRLATQAEGVWALGDCNGRGAFTHTAYNDFEILAANLLDGEDRRLGQRVPCYALYIDPPLGRAGMTETEARATGRKVLVATRPMARVARAREKGETRGLMRCVADAESGQILGAAILGVEGDEAVHSLLNAIGAGTPFETLIRTMPIHPTVSELIPTLLQSLAPAQ
ncbi:FAD-containing oxidoreductase [Pseudoroseomonas globiformis]|uniref:FAD-containing oxidoreductase n=1 Tax=Teichococcus globiformis TaxID=2307229 RepID=A0ABV7FY35_9PROT